MNLKLSTNSDSVITQNMFRKTFLGLICFFLANCANGIQDSLDEARFALDTGDYSRAVTSADTALTADPTNMEAAIVKATALAGRIGIELTKIADDLIDTAGTSGTNKDFSSLRTAFNAIFNTASDFIDLRTAITTLTGLTAPVATDPNYPDYHFLLGLLQTMEAFNLPTLTASPAGNTADNYDPSLVTATIRTNVQADFLGADDNLVKAGLSSSNDLIDTIRQNYCAIRSATTFDDATLSFTLAQLRDLIRCQLDDNSTTPNTAFEAVASCAEFDFSTCSGAGDTTL